MPSSFDRLFRLAKKTGHPIIIHDRTTDDDMVVLSLTEYEHLVDVAYEGVDEELLSWDDHGDKQTGEEPESIPFDETIPPPPASNLSEMPGMAHPDSTDWHHAGDVLEDVYGNENNEEEPKQPEKETRLPVPPASSGPSYNPLKQEPVSEEPVFYEEPVS